MEKVTYETANEINLSFKPGERVVLTELAGGDPNGSFVVDKIEIDDSFNQAVRYFLLPVPKSASKWYYSNQLRKF